MLAKALKKKYQITSFLNNKMKLKKLNHNLDDGKRRKFFHKVYNYDKKKHNAREIFYAL